MAGKLEGKVILITGAARGIGLGCAQAVLRHGGSVALADLQPDLATPTQNTLPIQCDVRLATDWERACEQTVAHFGRLDGLVNNAGWHPPPLTIEDTSLEDFENLLRLNLTSTFLGCKSALPFLKQTQGAIVNMSSEAGLIGQAMAPGYCATKAGQLGLTRALALDFSLFKVRVNAICPAGVATPLVDEWAASQPDPAAAIQLLNSYQPWGRMATTDEIGEVCAFLLSAEASFMTGQAICPDGGASLGYGNKTPERG